MQAEDSLDEARDPGGRAAKLAEESPGLEGGDGLLDEGTDPRVGPVDCLLTCGERLPPASVGNTDRVSGTLIALVRPAVGASLGERGVDAVLAGRTDIVDSPGPCRRGPQQATESSAMTCTFLPCFLCYRSMVSAETVR